jgi:pantoate--beta-alanine ligase
VQYLEIRDAETLAPAACADRPVRVLAAAYLGRTRLIDNVAALRS